MYRYFKQIAGFGTYDYIYYWQSKGLPNDRINSICPVQDGSEGEGKKPPSLPTSFPPVISTNEETSPQNLLTFSFDPFATLV